MLFATAIPKASVYFVKKILCPCRLKPKQKVSVKGKAHVWIKMVTASDA